MLAYYSVHEYQIDAHWETEHSNTVPHKFKKNWLLSDFQELMVCFYLFLLNEWKINMDTTEMPEDRNKHGIYQWKNKVKI